MWISSSGPVFNSKSTTFLEVCLLGQNISAALQSCIISLNSCGVADLLNNNFDYEVLDIYQDKEGNILQLLIKCDSLTINLINIYAPNRDNPNFLIKSLSFHRMKWQTIW